MYTDKKISKKQRYVPKKEQKQDKCSNNKKKTGHITQKHNKNGTKEE